MSPNEAYKLTEPDKINEINERKKSIVYKNKFQKNIFLTKN